MNNFIIFIIFIFLLVSGCSTRPIDLVPEIKMNKFKLENINPNKTDPFTKDEFGLIENLIHVDKIAKFLIYLIDEEEVLCNIHTDDASKILLLVHSEKDDARLKFSALSNKKKKALLQKFFNQNTCELNCTCGLYSDLLEDEKLKNYFYEKEKNLTNEEISECTKPIKAWICEDEILMRIQNSISK